MEWRLAFAVTSAQGPQIRTIRSASGLDRRGYTLVELVVSVAVAGGLLAVILPAVQSVRETSRRMECLNHQRQLALAALAYHDDDGQLPPWADGDRGAISVMFRYLELPDVEDCLISGLTRIQFLECPSDSALGEIGRPVSYCVNASPGPNTGSLLKGPFLYPLGAHPQFKVRLRDVTDGTSNTACMSETLIRRAGGSQSSADAAPRRYAWRVDVAPVSVDARLNPATEEARAERRRQTEQSIRDCLSGRREFKLSVVSRGATWARMSTGDTAYSHWLPPNSPHCVPNDSIGDPFLGQMVGARSEHPGGVNVAWLDGRATFVSESVARSVWRAAGTANGDESEQPQ